MEGQATFARFGIDVPCLVLNHSPGGASLLFAAGTRVPNAFDLAIGKGANALSVKVVWRNGSAVGVAFLVPRIVPDVIPG